MINIFDNRDRLGNLLILTFSLVYLRYIFDIPVDTSIQDQVFTARSLPFGLAVLAILCSLFQLVSPSTDQPKVSSLVANLQWKSMFLLTILMLTYSLVFSFLGFAIATFLFLVIGFVILGERRLWLGALVAGGLVLFLWLVLTQLLDLYLDNGTLLSLLFGVAS
jgi:putative tricarboxylic transport membrane protein